MAHIDPVSGQWVADDAGPVPSVPDGGSIGMQTSPLLPPMPAPVPAPVTEPSPMPTPAPPPAPAPTPPGPMGQLEAGNIDLNNRPIHRNPDGSISTVRSASFGIDGKEVLLPTIAPDGSPLTDQQAIALYMRTGQHLGKFSTPDAATNYAQKLHEDQAAKYLPMAAAQDAARAAGATASPGAPAATTPVLPPVGTLPGGRPQLIASQKLDTPEHVAALKNVDADNAAALDNSKQAGDLKVQAATNAVGQAQTTADLMQSALAERQQRQAAFAAQQVKDNAAVAKATADGLKDPDADESFAHRLLRALAIGLGQYSAAMNHTSNAAAEIFDADRKANIERQKAKVQAAKDAGKLNADQAQSDLNDLDAKELGQIKAFQSKWQAESARLGIPQARIDASATTVALQKQADEARAKLLDEDRVTVRDLTPKEVKEGKPKGAGGGNANALGDFIDRAGALKPGEAVPRDLATLGRKAGFKPNQIADQVEKYRNSGAKSTGIDAKATTAAGSTDGKEQATQIRGVDGEVFGHAPNIGNRLNPEIAHADTRTGNARALIDAFQELREDVAKNGNNLLPGTVASRNRQALIANIQAAKRVAESLPASEGGLHLEESQMPGSGQLIGLSTSPELIDKSIARIRDKVNQQNRAIVHDAPTEGPSDMIGKAKAAKAAMNGEPPAAAAAPKAPKVPAAVIEQAKAEVRNKGPHAASAQKLLDQQNITVL